MPIAARTDGDCPGNALYDHTGVGIEGKPGAFLLGRIHGVAANAPQFAVDGDVQDAERNHCGEQQKDHSDNQGVSVLFPDADKERCDALVFRTGGFMKGESRRDFANVVIRSPYPLPRVTGTSGTRVLR